MRCVCGIVQRWTIFDEDVGWCWRARAQSRAVLRRSALIRSTTQSLLPLRPLALDVPPPAERIHASTVSAIHANFGRGGPRA
jgi:hypothetical protein